jgi:hypothetical protein
LISDGPELISMAVSHSCTTSAWALQMTSIISVSENPEQTQDGHGILDTEEFLVELQDTFSTMRQFPSGNKP